MFYQVEDMDNYESLWNALSGQAQDDVSGIVNILAKYGPQLPFPYCSASGSPATDICAKSGFRGTLAEDERAAGASDLPLEGS